MDSSTGWLWVIVISAVLGAGFAALGNIKYNLAVEREKGQLASKKALEILKVELNYNLKFVNDMKANFNIGR
jgi:hypothetical protein